MRLLFTALIFLSACVKTTPTQVNEQPTTETQKALVTVATVPFVVPSSNDSWLGYAIANTLNDNLYFYKDIGSYTNRQVTAAMHQASLQIKTIANPENFKALGNLLGAHYLILGSLDRKDGNLSGTMQIVNNYDGSTLSQHTFTGKLPDFLALISSLENHIVTALKIEQRKVHKNPHVSPLALEACNKAFMIIQKQSLSPSSANPLAKLDITKPQLLQAKELLGTALKKMPECAAAQSAMALLLAMEGENGKALSLMKTVQSLPKSDSPNNILGYSFIHMRAGRFDQAEQILEKAVADHPGFLHGRGSLAEILLHFGRLRESRQAFQNYLDLVPQQPWILSKIAYVNSKLGKTVQAVAQTKKAVALVPHSTYLLTELASRQIDNDDLNGAQQTLKQVLKLLPNHPRAHIRLCYVQLLLGNDESATANCQKALTLASGSQYQRDRAYAYLNLGRILAYKGNLDDAISQIIKAKQTADISLDEITNDPDLDELHKDPRFISLLK